MKIAIVKLSALGDIVHAMVTLQFLKAALDGLQIDWVVEQRFAEVLHFNPDIDHILTVNLKLLKQNKCALFSEYRQLQQYSQKKYDLVIDAQGLIKSAVTAKLLGATTAGFDKNSIREPLASWFYDKKISIPYAANTIDRNACVIAEPLGLQITAEQILNKQPFLFFNHERKAVYQYFKKDKKNIIVVAGSTWESRNYPKQKFTAVAEALRQNCLVIWGNEQERRTAQWMQQQCNFITPLPKMDLNTLKAVIAKADLVIGNDTGPTHMAWALNKPSITLFGPTPVSRVYQTPINKVLKSPSQVNPYKLDKNDFSIREIDVAEVIELAKQLLTLNHE